MTEPSPSTEPRTPAWTRGTRRFVMASGIVALIALLLSVGSILMTAPWSGDTTFARAELFTLIKETRSKQGRWLKDTTDPLYRPGPRLKTVRPPVTFTLLRVEASTAPLRGETAVYRVELAGTVWTMRPHFDPPAAPKQKAPPSVKD